MPAPWYSVVHLDRLFIVTGTYDSGTDKTTWTLPISDYTIDTVVLGPDFAAAGDILNPTNIGDTLTLDGDFTDGVVAAGRSFTMSVELTRPYARGADKEADVDGFLGITKVVASYHNTAGLSMRCTFPGFSALRADRTVSLDIDPLVQRGTLTGWFNGQAKEMAFFLENTSPKPSTVVSVEFIGDYSPRVED